MTQPIVLQPLDQELTFCADEVPLLTAQVILPRWDSRSAGRFNRYYRACADSFQRLCRQELFPRAEAAYCRAREEATPIPQWQAQLTTTVTLRREHLISLHTDAQVTGMPRQYTARRGDTWDLRCGLLLSLSDCFPAHVCWRSELLDAAARQIETQLSRWPSRYRENWRSELRHAFHSHHFYLSEEGLCFFFPPDSIAPASAGIPTFCLPYDAQNGPFVPEI